MLIVFFLAFIFRDDIRESKYAKAKVEIFHRMMTKDVKEWPSDFRQVYDSLIVGKKDTVLLKEN